MSDNTQVTAKESEDAALAAPPDSQNPAIVDARKTFVYTMIGSIVFIGLIVVFIL